ncbi:MAG: type I restriction-modification system endonuclease, partial [Clostridiales bacterium]|nr:type I restriction-modification system endonuclease [Clostridiales bacterium]
GWEADTKNIRYSKGTRPQKGHNLAIAEYPTDSTVGDKGFADYALFIGEKLIAIVEAKASHKDIPAVIDYQGKDYPRCIRAEDEKYVIGKWGEYKVPFTFATNGREYVEKYKEKSGIWFLDLRRADNIPRPLLGWMSPDGMEEMLSADIEGANEKLLNLSYDFLTEKNGLGLRPYQINAIKAAENAIVNGQRSVLIAMATGTGKTRTIIGLIYRFLKTGRFRRVLYLVDRTVLGDQAKDAFKGNKIEDFLTVDEMYDIKTLGDIKIEKETRIHIATVQGMMKRILYNDGEAMPSVSDYDLVIVDEAHRGYILDREMTDEEILYRDQLDYQSKYRKVVEYFDAIKIAMTATPAKHTVQIFGKSVFTYSYGEAVIDGYLVDYDAPHDIKTKLSTEGIHYKSGDEVTLFDPLTGEVKDSELLEDELDFDVEDFNRKVITEEFNRAVLKEIARDLDPENPNETGKTLIFAVNDAHADLIVDILREIYSEFGVDNNAIMKITGSVANGDRNKIKQAVRHFKNDNYPSIVVTVDLLTTGIDVPKITSLVFMRRVKSRILYEQMLGRATRPCEEIHKDHFEIYDPVGLYDVLEPVNTMKSVAVNPSATFSQLLDRLEETEEEPQVQSQINQILAKLQRKKQRMDGRTEEHFKDMSGGLTPAQFVEMIKNQTPDEAKKRVLSYADLFHMLQESQPNGGRPIVISDKPDELVSHTRGYGKNGVKPGDYLVEFSEYINTHINEVAALNIICTRPSDLTRDDLKSLTLKLGCEGYTEQQLNTAFSEMTNEEMAADIISMVRRYAIGSTLTSHEDKIKNAVEKLEKAHDFTRQEQSWLKRMEGYLMKESVLNVQAFNEDSRFKDQGGFAKINKFFGGKLEDVVRELNGYLYDDGGKTA